MRVTMDRVGRVVVPKSLRDELGLTSETEFDAVIDGSGIRLEPRSAAPRRVKVVQGWPVLTAVPGAITTDDDVRKLRDSGQR